MQEIVGIIVVVVTVISWIIRKVSGENAPMQQPVPRPGKPRAQRVDDEIEAFLKQVKQSENAGEAPRQPEKRPQQQQRPNKQQNRPKAPGNKGNPPVSQRPQNRPAPPERATLTGGNVADRKNVLSDNMGGELRTHVQNYMTERVSNTASQDVGQSVRESVQQHMGNAQRQQLTSTFGPSAISTDVTARPFEKFTGVGSRKDLMSASNIRQAIIVQEILAPPRSLRKKAPRG